MQEGVGEVEEVAASGIEAAIAEPVHDGGGREQRETGDRGAIEATTHAAGSRRWARTPTTSTISKVAQNAIG